jgi:alanyl-tRNA synthetase
MNVLLRKVLDELGGKGGGSKDFARGALSDSAKVAAALELASSLLNQSQSATSA